MSIIDRDYIENLALNSAYFALDKIGLLFKPIEYIVNHYSKTDSDAENEVENTSTYGMSIEQLSDLANIPNLSKLYKSKAREHNIHTANDSDGEKSLSLIFNHLPKHGWLDTSYDRIVTRNHNSGFCLTIEQGNKSKPYLNTQLSISFREYSRDKFEQSGFLSVGGNFQSGRDYLDYISQRNSWLKPIIEGTATTVVEQRELTKG